MNQHDLERFISKDHITWESIKLTILSEDNVTTVSKSFSDDSVIIDSVIYMNTSKGNIINIANNEFVVLLTGCIADFNSTTNAFAYDLTNNQANLSGAYPGTIFFKSLHPAVGGYSSFTFLLFRIN
jgi:hypothetical protein